MHGDGRLGRAHDAVLAVALTAAGWTQISALPLFIEGWRGGPQQRPPIPDEATAFGGVLRVSTPTPMMYVLTALAFLPLALRRRFPLAVLAVATVSAGVYDRMFHAPSFITIAPLIALYTVGTLRDRRVVWLAAAASFAFTVGLAWPDISTSRLIGEVVRVGATFAVAASLGDAARNRRAYIAEVEERAAQAERSREEDARRRVEEERLRIARELHDVTAHSLSLIAVQAGAAEKIVERDPAAARQALETIRLTSKASLDELRAMLGVLRGHDDAPLSPAGRLEGLPHLVASIEKAGIAVTLETIGDLTELPAYADVSVYRIVQEALTNVVRHAGATDAHVALRRTGDVVEVEVTDNGNTARSGTQLREGHGITGMRERAVALGGSFEAGPAPVGGFRVRAVLPVAVRGAAR